MRPSPDVRIRVQRDVGEGPRSALAGLHRLDHAGTYLPTFAWGALVVASGISALWSPWLLVGLAINALTVFGGFVLNTVVDIRSDLRNAKKRYMTDALRSIGVQRAVRIYFAEQVSAIAIAMTAAVALDRPFIVGATILAIAANWAYSAPPFRMKSRIIIGPLCMGIKSGLAPGLIAMSTVPDTQFNAAASVLLFGLTLSTASRGVWHSIPDLHADQASGIHTIAVRHGAVRAAQGAVLATAIGCGLNLAACIWLMGWWGLVACTGMVITIYHRYRVGSLADESAIIDHMNEPRSEVINARWNRATYSILCVASLGHLVIPG
ncbi:MULTISPECIES: UbiA prenyltransferase family protein [unclassified Rhodococcus (in: high G+C Gram-positive bacteria)]|uniref:UbiA prenyltransferase family protein n=1 Tax=unclassified Rhodococcus (in: high G+C Gram-positive bacteria) TaxID=192944 RepID=UPI0013200D25|nr:MULTISPECIES: UbiA family prenyltransferase [unclassified Rhodococcus (in: high G+C Gram-positive bacteria)]QHE74528.1 hypothetical protein GFS60_08232 [Rhodococcus sp. WAY2]